MARHTTFRILHDVGLASWFGGSLMGAVGLNGAAAALSDPRQRSSAATAGWNRWAPVNAAGIAAHVAGAAGLLVTDWPRVRTQEGVLRSSLIKTGLTAAALGTTAWSGALNKKMNEAGPVPVEGATEPSVLTPPDVAAAQKQLKAVQWLIPGITGALYGVASWQSEQQRAAQVTKGVVRRLPSTVGPVPLAAVAAGLLLAARKRSASKRLQDEAIYPPEVLVVPAGPPTTTTVGTTAPSASATRPLDGGLPPTTTTTPLGQPGARG